MNERDRWEVTTDKGESLLIKPTNIDIVGNTHADTGAYPRASPTSAATPKPTPGLARSPLGRTSVSAPNSPERGDIGDHSYHSNHSRDYQNPPARGLLVTNAHADPSGYLHVPPTPATNLDDGRSAFSVGTVFSSVDDGPAYSPTAAAAYRRNAGPGHAHAMGNAAPPHGYVRSAARKKKGIPKNPRRCILDFCF